MRITVALVLSAASLLVACGRSEQPTPAPTPAAATQPAAIAATLALPAVTHPAPVASTAPPATTAISAATSAAPSAASATPPENAGSVALSQGNVTDTATDGSSRQLKDGDVVYPGDAFALSDDSYLDLDLEDGGRILLRPDTSFQIQEYHFDPDAHPAAGEQPLLAAPQEKPESAFFKLVKGGLRAVDGLIGQTTPKNYGIVTPVATIGVRGTAFDVRYCGDDCGDEKDASGAPQNGLYTAVSEGSIGVKNDGGETVTKAGEYGYVKDTKSVAERRTTPPRALRHMALPDKLKARDDKNRQQIHTQRQQRRQQVLEKRRQQVADKAKPPAVKADQIKPSAAKEEAKTPRERRQERMQERRQQKSAEAAGQQARQPEEQSAPANRGEQRREQMKERRQQRQAEKSEAGKAAVSAQPEQKGKDAKEACKDKKKKRRGKDKDKDKCGDD